MKSFLLFLFLLPLVGKGQDHEILTAASTKVRKGTYKEFGRLQLLPHPLGIREMRDERFAYIEYEGKKYYVTSTKNIDKKLVLNLNGGGVAVLNRSPNTFTLTIPEKDLSLVLEDCTFLMGKD
ncbi:hypothetical protein Q5H92_14795 [Hymenobacter sp. M29]|uniref:Uncharacterized protein n=1 Tax=Hymenobacter mellowenesis TaxID=3063995 RepID=A0ABT9ACQ1_9BACT|nr:hypothetical protein [Hymenobacter sp. M29]MDO7847634.1 hypothetical protein [Hymenobacter sp. M29]